MESRSVREALCESQRDVVVSALARHEEESFVKFMSRKARTQTSGAITGGQLGAGSVKAHLPEEVGRKCGLEVEKSQQRNGRDGVALILSPRASDPPHRHDRIIEIGNKKAGSPNKDKFSAESEYAAVRWNQQVFRYSEGPSDGDAASEFGNSRSLSCPTFCPVRDLITHDNLTEDKAQNHRNLTLYGVERFLKGQETKTLTDHASMAKQAVGDRSHRLANDTRFAELCKVAAASGSQTAQEVGQIKVARESRLSTNVASALTWID